MQINLLKKSGDANFSVDRIIAQNIDNQGSGGTYDWSVPTDLESHDPLGAQYTYQIQIVDSDWEGNTVTGESNFLLIDIDGDGVETQPSLNTENVRIHNYGDQLRFSNGLEEKPKIMQYIDRDLFWGESTEFSHAYTTQTNGTATTTTVTNDADGTYKVYHVDDYSSYLNYVCSGQVVTGIKLVEYYDTATSTWKDISTDSNLHWTHITENLGGVYGDELGFRSNDTSHHTTVKVWKDDLGLNGLQFRITYFRSDTYGYKGLHYDTSYPRLEDTDFNFSISEDTTGDDLGMNLGSSSTHTSYYYKMSPVFDGNQEGAITKNFHADTSLFTSNAHSVNLDIQFNGSVNPRLTSFKLYRAKVNPKGIYEQIANISTGGRLDDGTIEFSTDFVQLTNKLYTPQPVLESVNATSGLTPAVGDYIVFSASAYKGWGYDDTETEITTITDANRIELTHSSTIWAMVRDIVRFDNNKGVDFPFNFNESSGWVTQDATGFTEDMNNDGGTLRAKWTTADNEFGAITFKTNSPNITVTAGKSYYIDIQEMHYYLDTVGTGANWMKAYVKDGSNTTQIGDTLTGVGSDGLSAEEDRQMTYTPVTGTITIELWVHSAGGISGGGEVNAKADNVRVGQIGTVVVPDIDWFGGDRAIYFPTNTFGNQDSQVNKQLLISENGEIDTATVSQNVDANIRSVLRVPTAISSNATHLYLVGDYYWEKTSLGSTLKFQDKFITPTTEHPFGDVPLTLNYSDSFYMNGRNFVTKGKMINNAVEEDHKNWVWFSELGQPDVIPITNYIQIKDRQGGDTTALIGLLGNLAVFSERGIFNLNIPSADPTAWTMDEAEPNLGTKSADSIVEYKGGAFFCTNSGIYYLSPNFEVTELSKAISDEYKSIYSEGNAHSTIDVLKNRLCVLPSKGDSIEYILDLNTLNSPKWHTRGSSSANVLTKDEDNKIYSIRQNGSSSIIYDMESESYGFTQLGEQEAVFKTGWISTSELGRRENLKKISLKYVAVGNFKIDVYSRNAQNELFATVDDVGIFTGANSYFTTTNATTGRVFERLSKMKYLSIQGTTYNDTVFSEISTPDAEITGFQIVQTQDANLGTIDNYTLIFKYEAFTGNNEANVNGVNLVGRITSEKTPIKSFDLPVSPIHPSSVSLRLGARGEAFMIEVSQDTTSKGKLEIHNMELEIE